MKILLLLTTLLVPQEPARPVLGEISGQIRTMDRSDPAPIRVIARPVNDNGEANPGAVPLAGVFADSQGRYRLQNLPAGNYLIVAGLFDSPTYFPGVRTPAEARRISVGTGQTLVNVDFTLAHPDFVGRVPGRVRVDDGSPLPVSPASSPGDPEAPSVLALQVVVAGTAGVTNTETVRRDGVFSLPFYLPGPYVVAPARMPLGYYVKSITHGTADLTNSPFTVNAGSPSTEMEIVLTKTPPAGEPPAVKLSGRVIGMENVPAGTTLRLVLQSTRIVNEISILRLGETAVNRDGTFEIRGVPAGRYSMISAPPQREALGNLEVTDRDISGLELTLSNPTNAFMPSILVLSNAPITRYFGTPNVVPPPPLTPPSPGMASLHVSQGLSPIAMHGAMTFFRVERSSERITERRLDGSPAISLAPGTYEIHTWVRTCGDAGCDKVSPPIENCVATFGVTAGQILYAERVVQGATCTLQFRRP
jgi:hypothetical protein